LRIYLIAARSLNNVIGRGSEIPWQVKGEQRLFKEITMGHTLIMGRKTFESIGRPLPGRDTVIMTRRSNYHRDGCSIAASLSDALGLGGSLRGSCFIAGGGEIYRQAISRADGIHLTTIHTEVEGDILFPDFSRDVFKMKTETLFQSNIDYTYRYFERHTE
jgi:dihydrofolate reductase